MFPICLIIYYIYHIIPYYTTQGEGNPPMCYRGVRNKHMMLDRPSGPESRAMM